MSTKFLKHSAIVALLLASATPTLTRAQAAMQDAGQEQAGPAPKGANRPNLNLTEDQKAQVKKIHEDAKTQIEAVNNDASLSADQKQEKIKQIHRETHKQVMSMLTPDQRKTMRQWRQEHHGEHNPEAPSGN